MKLAIFCFVAAVLAGIMIYFVLYGAIIYTAAHFIKKYW